MTTDDHGRTSLTGVWAIGNVTDPRAQLITAAGDDSRAAVDINNHLIASDLARTTTTARTEP